MSIKVEDIQLHNFSLCNVLGVILLDPRKNKNGLYNVRYRLTFKGERKYISTGHAYSLVDWERITSNKVRDEELKQQKKDILNRFEIIKNTIDLIVNEEKKPFSYNLLDKKLARGDRSDIFRAFDSKIERLTAEGRITTAVSYISTLGSLWQYINKYEGEISFSKLYKSGEWKNKEYRSLSFDRINEDFVKNYKQKLIDKGRSDATIGIYLRSLRAILNENDVPINKYPFGKDKITIPNGSSRKIALSKDIISLIAQHPLTGNAKMYRDIWIFSYLCNGANLKDILRLKQKNISGNFIYFKRAKTERTSKDPKEIKVPIHPEMKRIIDHYGNESNGKETFIFPFLTPGLTPDREIVIIADYNRRINRAMKNIAKKLDIDANITLYSARHSYAVNSERSGQRTSLISKALGHTNISTTISYLESFDDAEIVDNSNKLL